MLDVVRNPPVDSPGLYALTANEYHADPCPKPSLNHTIAKIIHDKSPLHAYKAHPRLGNEAERPVRIMDIGTAVHAMAIGVGATLAKLDFKDYRTKAAQQARDALLASGVTPLLAPDYDLVQSMAPPMRDAIEHVAGAKIDLLCRETVAVAVEGHVWSRCMVDVMTPDMRLLIDAKTTRSANPDEFAKMVRNDYATAVAFYFQTLDLLDPEGAGKRRFVFIAQERDCPEAITYHELDPAQLEIADAQMRRARLRWALCSHTNTWPSYDRGPYKVSPRMWDLEQEHMRAAAEAENTSDE